MSVTTAVRRIRNQAALGTRFRGTAARCAGTRSVVPSGVAITFDDGPDPVHTPLVLDVLRERNARATFFCIGDAVRAHPELVERMLDEGHAVGSHSMTHPECRHLSIRECVREFRDGRRALEEVARKRSALFRPPHGDIDSRIAIAMRTVGLEPWLWTVDPGDWKPSAETDEIASVGLRARDGDVVVLHDGLFDPVSPEATDRSRTIAALPVIIDGLINQGLALVPLS